MSDEEWAQPWIRTFGLQLGGGPLDVVDELGDPVVDDSLIILLNAHDETVQFTLPPAPALRGERKARGSTASWQTLVDTALPERMDSQHNVPAQSGYDLQGLSLVLLKWGE